MKINTNRIDGLRIALQFAESFEHQATANATRAPFEVGCIANGIRACIHREMIGEPMPVLGAQLEQETDDAS